MFQETRAVVAVGGAKKLDDSPMLRALKEDAKRMEDVACEAGYRIKGYAVKGKTPSQVQWAVAVAVLHLLQVEIKRGEKK